MKNIKIEGDYVEFLPNFFETIKEFDLIQVGKLKLLRDYVAFLEKKLLKKLEKNRVDFQKINNKRV